MKIKIPNDSETKITIYIKLQMFFIIIFVIFVYIRFLWQKKLLVAVVVNHIIIVQFVFNVFFALFLIFLLNGYFLKVLPGG